MKKDIIKELDKLKKVAEPANIAIEEVEVKKALTKIIKDIKDTLNNTTDLMAVSAPQLGYNSRIIGIKFNDQIKIFINPVVVKKLNYALGAENFSSMPNKEILIMRPEEVQLVYYNDKIVYEDNKLLGAAARIFDQQYQLLDGVTPDELGLVSEPEVDGKIADLSEEEFEQVKDIYQQMIAVKTKAMQDQIANDENKELAKQYNELKFAERVIAGKAAVIEDDAERKAFNKRKAFAAATVSKSISNANKQYNRAKLSSFLKKAGK